MVGREEAFVNLQWDFARFCIVGWLETKEDCRGEDVDFMDCFTLDLNVNTSNRGLAGHSCFIIALIYTVFHGFTRISHPTCSLVCIMVEPFDGTQFIGIQAWIIVDKLGP